MALSENEIFQRVFSVSEPNSSVEIDKTKTERLSLLDLTSASTSIGSATQTSNADEEASGMSFSSASDMPVQVVKLNIMEELTRQNAKS